MDKRLVLKNKYKGSKKVNQTLFQMGIGLLVQGVEKLLEGYDQKTGRFLAKNGGWTNRNQDNMFTLAFLYRTGHPDNPYYHNKMIINVVEKAGNALREVQNADGKMVTVKTDGSRWSESFIPWTYYYWLETYDMVKSVLTEESRKSWREGLLISYAGINEMLKGIRVHNTNVYHAMALQRAAQILEQPEWITVADEMIQRTVDAQKGAGYWEEHLGPTTNYNRHYVHALGLYYYHGGKVNVIPALEKSMFFQVAFTYPDGTRVETIDGRVKYNRTIRPLGMTGLGLFPKGRDYCRFLMEQAGANSPDMFSADLTAFLLNIDPDADEIPSIVRKKQLELDVMNVLILKNQDMFVCMSGITTPVSESRWAQDRQMFFSIWHSSYGLLVGGGNSKKQPERSTFVIRNGEEVISYVPDNGHVNAEQKELILNYGDAQCSICIDKLDTDSLTFIYKAVLKNENEANINIPIILIPGSKLVTGEGKEWIVGEDNIEFFKGDGKHCIQIESTRLEFEGPATFKWPSLPFNPYEKEGEATIDEAVAILTLLASDEKKSVSVVFNYNK